MLYAHCDNPKCTNINAVTDLAVKPVTEGISFWFNFNLPDWITYAIEGKSVHACSEECCIKVREVYNILEPLVSDED